MRRLLALPAAGLLVLALTAQGGGGMGAPGPDDPCPTAYPGDGADKARIARWMARGAALRGLPDELPAIAAIAETGVANIRSPDRRYVGYFQMDVEFWNAGDYRGYPRNPELQLRWFADHAVLVRQRKIAEGDADFGRDEADWGRWVGIVENPGRPAVAHYARRLDEAKALVGGDCLPVGARPDVAPPKLRIAVQRVQQGAIAVRARCPAEDCVAAVAVATRAGKPRGRARALALTARRTTTFAVRPRGASGPLRVQVTAVDEAGKAARAARTVSYTR